MRIPVRHSLVVSFAVLSSVSLGAIGLALAVELGGRIQQDALKDARDVASVSARFGVQPEISARAIRGGLPRGTLDRVDRALRAERIGQRVVRVKVWNPRGRVVYSDDRRLVNKGFPISEELASALDGRIASEVSSLTEKEQA